MSIKQLTYDRIRKDLHHLNKQYANGTGIAGYTIYATDDTKPALACSNPSNVVTEFCGATQYSSYIYAFSAGYTDGSKIAIYSYQMPIAGGDWDVAGTGEITINTVTSAYVDGQYTYFNYNDGAAKYIRLDMSNNTWGSPTAGTVTTGALLTTTYTYNERTYSGDGKFLTTSSKYFIPLVKIA